MSVLDLFIASMLVSFDFFGLFEGNQACPLIGIHERAPGQRGLPSRFGPSFLQCLFTVGHVHSQVVLRCVLKSRCQPVVVSAV